MLPAVQFLLGRIDYERMLSMPTAEAAYKLSRMRDLLHRLGNPQAGLPIVHVAGTKGKGSTAAMIAAVLSASGRRTGLFTSPHLDRVEERIAIDGQPCTAEELAALINAVRPAVEALDRAAAESDPPEHGPTYFEIITAMALLHFARRNAAAAVLEVGLGGRLDSTNVCRPRVSVITSISFDHTKQLGETLAAIAAEKAGIIKHGVPVVSGVTDDEPRKVIREIAHRNGCRLIEQGVDFDYRYHPPHHLEHAVAQGRMDYGPLQSLRNVGQVANLPESRQGGTQGGTSLSEVKGVVCPSPTPFASLRDVPPSSSTYRGATPHDREVRKNLALGLLGRHQAANAAVALAAIDELRRAGWEIAEEAVRRGLADASSPARVEVVARRPTVIFDAAHNEASIAALLEVLDESFSARQRWLIFATTRDKDVRGMLGRLLARFDHVALTQYSSSCRAVPAEELQSLALELSVKEGTGSEPSRGNAAKTDGREVPVPFFNVLSGPRPSVYATPAAAWDAVRRQAAADDLICITGSFFLAGEMRRLVSCD